MPEKFPHQYQVNLSHIEGNKAKVHYDNAPIVQGGPPKQFDGDENDWSPEGFLMSGVALCFLTTLKAIHKDESIEINDLDISVQGTLDKTKEGLAFTSIETKVSCQTNTPEKTESLLRKAEKFCLVSNALKTKPKLTIQFI